MATTTVLGNLTGPIELRFTQAGKALANVTVAVNEKKFNRQTNQYEDGETWFARGTLWGSLAENAANSLSKGDRVVGSARIRQRDWEDKEGNKRSSVEVEFDSFGPDLRFATATVTRAQNGGNGGSSWHTAPEQSPPADFDAQGGFPEAAGFGDPYANHPGF